MCQKITHARVIHYTVPQKLIQVGWLNNRLGFHVGTSMEIPIFFYMTGLQLVLVNEQGDLGTASL